MHNKKCSNNCQGCQCHKGKDPKVKRHEHEDFEKKSEMNNSCQIHLFGIFLYDKR